MKRLAVLYVPVVARLHPGFAAYSRLAHLKLIEFPADNAVPLFIPHTERK